MDVKKHEPKLQLIIIINLGLCFDCISGIDQEPSAKTGFKWWRKIWTPSWKTKYSQTGLWHNISSEYCFWRLLWKKWQNFLKFKLLLKLKPRKMDPSAFLQEQLPSFVTSIAQWKMVGCWVCAAILLVLGNRKVHIYADSFFRPYLAMGGDWHTHGNWSLR